MGWQSIYFDKKTQTRKTGSISKEQLRLAEEIAPAFFTHREQLQECEFYVQDMVRWVRTKYPKVAPYVSQTPRGKVRAANPGKSILDIQDLCYQLSDPENFWIEDSKTGKRLAPLTRLGKHHYELKKRWKSVI